MAGAARGTRSGACNRDQGFPACGFVPAIPRRLGQAARRDHRKQLLDLVYEVSKENFQGSRNFKSNGLAITAAIYGNLYDEERYAAAERRIELARAHYGSCIPSVIEGLTSEATLRAFDRTMPRPTGCGRNRCPAEIPHARSKAVACRMVANEKRGARAGGGSGRTQPCASTRPGPV